MKIVLHPIGTLHTPFNTLEDMPIQPAGRTTAEGWAEIFEQYAQGLNDLDGFSHLILVYHLHKAERTDLTVVPFLDDQPRGVFATRAPTRPNHIGLSVVRLKSLEGRTLKLTDLDMLDGTPLLDLKPYVPDFDHPPEVRIGWLEAARAKMDESTSDDRFK